MAGGVDEDEGYTNYRNAVWGTAKRPKPGWERLEMKWSMFAVVGLALACFGLASANAAVTLTVYPNQVPDEKVPAGIMGDYPTGWGTSSWQSVASGKSNFHIRAGEDGDLWTALFGATSQLSNLASLSYNTEKAVTAPLNSDWAMTIYTAKTGSGDAGSWFHSKLQSNYSTHTNTGVWATWSTTDGSLMFENNTNSGVYVPLTSLFAAHGTEVIEAITIQTFSNWTGSVVGNVDGIVIDLINPVVNGGNTEGRVNLEAVPEPATLAIWSLLGTMGIGGVWLRRKRTVA